MTAIASLQAQWPLLIVESLLVIVGFVLMLARKSSPKRGFPLWYRRLVRKKALSILLPGLLVLALRLALLPILGIPQPQWHDEFSYLLAADTFAHGRLTNPTPAAWQHFETFHVIFQPTYMSIYPPAQGIVLAVGQALGQPWVGQLLITAAMCSALCWMLRGWLPPAWAVLGGLLAVIRLGVLSYWMNGYWSTSVVALAGALILGSLPRIKRRGSISSALWMSVGLGLLANSRPYEGLVLALAVGASLLIWFVGEKRTRRRALLKRVIAPALTALAFAALATGYYCHQVTGSAFRMAYQVDQELYASVPFFIFQSPRPEPTYRDETLRVFYDIDRKVFEDLRTPRGFIHQSSNRILNWWSFYLGPLLTVPLLMLPWMLHDRRIRFALITVAVMGVALSCVTWFLPHYFAPATGLLYLILIQGLRHVSHSRMPAWRGITRTLVLIACSMFVLRIAAIAAHAPLEPRWPRGNLARANLVSILDKMPGPQLVIVRYTNSHDPTNEWVYNSADLQQSKVIWARDMGRIANDELLRAFPNRESWVVYPDVSPTSLKPYQP